MDKFFDIVSNIDYDNMKLVDPNTFYIPNVGVEQTEEVKANNYYVMEKGAIRNFYGIMKLSYQVSKKLYSMLPDIWEDVINIRMSSIPDYGKFKFKDMSYVVLRGTNKIVGITNNRFLNKLMDSFFSSIPDDVNIIYNSRDVIQVEYSINIDDSVSSLVSFDYDIFNGIFKLYTGVKLMDNDRDIIYLVGCPAINTTNIDEMLTYDIMYEADMSVRSVPTIVKSFDIDRLKDFKLSVREVLDIMKMSGIKPELTGVEFLGYPDMIDDSKMKSFFDSFNIPYKSLVKLNPLRKSIKTDSISLYDLMVIMTDEYYNEHNNVNASVLSKLSEMYNSEEIDSYIISREI